MTSVTKKSSSFLSLKEIVLNVHKAQLYFQEYNSQNQSRSLSHETKILLEKISFAWPLERGSVQKKILAWQTSTTYRECLQHCLAFVIKCFFVFGGLNSTSQNTSSTTLNSETFSAIENLASCDFFSLFFWSDIKRYYSFFQKTEEQPHSEYTRQKFIEHRLKHNLPVILCLEDTFFRTRYGTNQDLSMFESLIEDLNRCATPLIVFSKQALFFPENKKQFKYSQSFKLETNFAKISLKDVLEPDLFVKKSASFIEPVKTGCFDRLLELLAQGQDFIFSVEKAFEQKLGETYEK